MIKSFTTIYITLTSFGCHDQVCELITEIGQFSLLIHLVNYKKIETTLIDLI